MMLRPLSNRLIVRRSEPAERSRGGIVLPDSARQTATQGEVLAAGPGFLLRSGAREPMTVRVGDVIAFPRLAGSDVRVGGEPLLILQEDEVLAVIAPPESPTA